MTQDKIDKVIDKLPDGNKALDVVSKLADQITTKVTEVAPKAWEVMKSLKQIDSLGMVVLHSIILVLAFIGAIVFFRISRHAFKKAEDAVDDEDYILGGLLMGASMIIAIGIVISSIVTLADIWIWMGIFRPDLAIAHDVYNATLGK